MTQGKHPEQDVEPVRSFRMAEEVALAIQPGCIVRLHVVNPKRAYVSAFVGSKHIGIPNGSLVMVVSLLETYDIVLLATILYREDVCIVKVCDISEVVCGGGSSTQQADCRPTHGVHDQISI